MTPHNWTPLDMRLQRLIDLSGSGGGAARLTAFVCTNCGCECERTEALFYDDPGFGPGPSPKIWRSTGERGIIRRGGPDCDEEVARKVMES